MVQEQAPVCTGAQRRADLIDNPNLTLNGIDYVEVDPADHRRLRVFFLKPLPPASAANPNDQNDAYGLTTTAGALRVIGGTRVVGIRVLTARRLRTPAGEGFLAVEVDRGGDFSVYTLVVDGRIAQIEPFRRQMPFSFMAACPVDVDCPREHDCPPVALEEPLLDYLAKDYASFRRLLLDLLPRVNPNFMERNPADLGIALVELLAYAGDYLSYFQDAVAAEAFLDTLRQRISARRHARLIDYRMHDGRNAWTYLHVKVAPGPANTLPRRTPVLTRVTGVLRGLTAPPGAVIDPSTVFEPAATIAPGRTVAGLPRRDPALEAVTIFETAHDARLELANNEIRVHAWGNEECCLRPGTTEVYLFTVDQNVASRPPLRRGDRLLFEEAVGPATGLAGDADRSHRKVVVIAEDPANAEDPLYGNRLSAAGELQRRPAGSNPLPLLRVRWSRADALAFPLCLSARTADGRLIRDVSVARGNIVLADHGRTIVETVDLPAPLAVEPPFRLPLTEVPLTMACRPLDASGRPALDRRDLACDVREARPFVDVAVTARGVTEPWTAEPDLLDSPRFEPHFVAEVDDEGRALLRFGDGEYGRHVGDATRFRAEYRIGSGRAGNVGAESLVHLALPGGARWVLEVRNPLAARGGVDPEMIEEVRQRAPEAFRARQFRAVTEADYASAARDLPAVAGAVASFRWTGSWYTVCVGVDPAERADLIDEPGGRTRLAPSLERRVRDFLAGRRLAGYDLEIRAPNFVPLQLAVELCVAPDYFRTDVARAVAEELSARALPGGRRGFFHPDNLTFGQPVYLSRIYAAVARVAGVDSVVVRAFQRFGQGPNGELDSGVLPIGPWEIARLENDPNFLEHGMLAITPLGGKG